MTIVNTKLANNYIKSMLGSLLGKPTLGKGFPVYVSNAGINYNNDSLKISSTSGIFIE